MKPITLLIVDDHQMVRDTFVAILQREQDIEIVGQAVDGQEGVDRTAELKPDVVTLDVSMPNLDGFEAARNIRHNSPATRILMVSAFDDDATIRQATEVGADGFVSKSLAAETLAKAAREVARGRKAFSPLE